MPPGPDKWSQCLVDLRRWAGAAVLAIVASMVPAATAAAAGPASIAGTITLEGDAIGVPVTVEVSSPTDGTTSVTVDPDDETDASLDYLVEDLAEDAETTISFTSDNGDVPTIWWDGATSEGDATAIDLAAATETNGIDVTLGAAEEEPDEEPTEPEPDDGRPHAPISVDATSRPFAADVEWVPAETGGEVDHYVVEVFPRIGVERGTVRETDDTVMHFDGLRRAVIYSFTVTAVNHVGSSEGTSSNTVKPTRNPPPPRPPRVPDSTTTTTQPGGSTTTTSTTTTTTTPPPEPVTERVRPSGGSGSGRIGVSTPQGTIDVTINDLPPDGVDVVVTEAELAGRDRRGMTLVGVAYDITVNGAVGSSTVCLPYDSAAVAAAFLEEADLQLFHFGETRGVITTTVDTANDQVCGVTDSFSVFAIGAFLTERVAGTDRYATAASIASATFRRPRKVYIASGAGFADALAAGPAAAASAGPILLTAADELPDATAAELARLRPRQIIVLGGAGAVSDAVVEELAAIAKTRRIAGADRYATAAAISAEHFDAGVTEVYVASGQSFADALAGGAAAAAAGVPILLTQRDELPAATAAELQRLAPGRIVLLGGTAAVSDAVATALGAHGAVERIAGSDRFATAAAVSAGAFSSGAPAFIATGGSFADALAAIPATAALGATLLLTSQSTLPAATGTELDRLDPGFIVVLGGRAAISDQCESDIAHTLRG